MTPPRSIDPHRWRELRDGGLVVVAGAVLAVALGTWLNPSLEAARPQDPAVAVRPAPYRSIDLTVDGDGVVLGGTLVLPAAEGAVPGVVLVSGAGAQDRDGRLAGHRRFAVLADALARAGVASLRLDDRGVGASTGSYLDSTFEDRAGDVVAAWTALAARPEIDGRRVGILGASEGSVVGALAATRTSPAFLVLVSPLAESGREAMLSGLAEDRLPAGVTPAEAAEVREALDAIFGLLREDLPAAERRARLRPLVDRVEGVLGVPGTLATLAPAAHRERRIDLLLSPAMADALFFDPTPLYAEISSPVLAVGGTLDRQVDAGRMIERLRLHLSHVPFRGELLPGLNHLLQPAETGSPDEYARIETTFAPEVLELLSDWIGNPEPRGTSRSPDAPGSGR